MTMSAASISLRNPAREVRYAEDFWNFGIRGVIIGSSPLDLGHLADLQRRGLRIVVFDRVDQGDLIAAAGVHAPELVQGADRGA